MSKKASISKRGGHTPDALRDVVGHPNSDPQAPPSLVAIDPLDAFDALLPAWEEQSPAQSLSKCVKPQALLTAASASAAIPPQPIGEFVSEHLQTESTTPSPVDLLESLRYWESELRQTELDLQLKSDDLAARRREFARQLRAQRRDLRLAATASNAGKSSAESTETADARLAEMQSQIEMLVTLLRESWPTSDLSSQDPADGSGQFAAAPEIEAAHRAEIESFKSQIEALVEQNNQLATELAHLTVQRTVDQSSDAAASMSWEERKEMLYRQFECEDNGVPFNPEHLSAEQCSRLNHEMACMQQELRARENEIAELRSLLEQRPEVKDDGLAVGAAAITRLFDDDELIREERSRLKDIQAEWEAKFRDMEIAASIERASLARERRQLECQNAELEEQLAHLKQELRQESIAGPAQQRRWFAKLGLGD